MIDPETIRHEVISRLPVRARWVFAGLPWVFDFSRSHAPLRTIDPIEIGGDIQESWKDLYLFGDEDYADGGGASPFIGVHRRTGEILGLDLERESTQIFLLNSRIDAFIRTFQALDRVLGPEGVEPVRLAETLMQIDPQAFSNSEWRELCGDIVRARTQRCSRQS